MESRNPVFSRRGAFGQQSGYAPSAQYLQNMYNAPAYAPQRSMTIDDVVVRSFLTLGTLTIAGALAWVFVPDRLANAVALVAVIVGVVFWAIVKFGRKVNGPLVLGFAASYGVAVGVISHAYNDVYNGVVLQAVIGTALAFGAMLTVYSLRIIRVTPKFARFAIAAGLALVGLMILNLLVSIFHVGGIGIRGNGRSASSSASRRSWSAACTCCSTSTRSRRAYAPARRRRPPGSRRSGSRSAWCGSTWRCCASCPASTAATAAKPPRRRPARGRGDTCRLGQPLTSGPTWVIVDADQHSAVTLHDLAVVVPVRMFTRDHPVVVDERLHGLRQVQHLRLTVDLDPLTEEGIGEQAQRHSGIT